MKNIVRIFLLLILIFVASKVLFSDFHLPKTENETVTIAKVE